MEMMKSAFFFSYIFLVFTISTTPAHSAYYNRSRPYRPSPLMKTQLRFFLHDTLSGSNATAVRIAGPRPTKYNPIPFGSLLAIHDPLTEEPEISSKTVGNAQGLYVSSSQGEVPSIVMYADFSFTRGRFKGSSLSVFSRNPVTEKLRELAVVGGKGLFRMAKGTVFVTTHYVDIATGDAVLEYNVEVIHPYQENVA